MDICLIDTFVNPYIQCYNSPASTLLLKWLIPATFAFADTYKFSSKWMHSGSNRRLPNMFSSVLSLWFWSRHVDGPGDKLCSYSNNPLLACLCRRAPWLFNPFHPRCTWTTGMMESVLGAHSLVSTLHKYKSAPPSLSPDLHPSHPPTQRAVHFSSGRKALHRAR